MDQKLLHVFIVDDSKVSRTVLAHILQKDPQIKVVGFAETGEEALKLIPTLPIDVVTMDIHLPGIDGFEVTRKIMETNPLPIVVISGLYHREETAQAFKAMEAGALAILEKPGSVADKDFQEKEEKILSTIKMIAEVKLIKRRKIKSIYTPPSLSRYSAEAVAIGSSLGGPPVLATIFSKLSPDFPIPIFVVQHISPGFVNGLVDWLQMSAKIKIALAEQGEIAQPGRCYIAPDGFQMEIQKQGKIHLISTPNKTQPSVEKLFKSMSEAYGSNAVGIILTGMGKDGAKELLTMRNKGALTIAQEEKSCVVFGMPGEAVAIGAAQLTATPEQIADILNELVLEAKEFS